MPFWTTVEGTLADGERVTLFIAAEDGTLVRTAMHSRHGPLAADEFTARLGGAGLCKRWPAGTGSGLLDAAVWQIEDYFRGSRLEFDLPLAPFGTPFQKSVWNLLARISYGETRSYRELAQTLGRANAVRAVGQANARNPLCLLLPCHRVVASDGRLTGFAGGVGLKRSLLDHEACVLSGRASGTAPA